MRKVTASRDRNESKSNVPAKDLTPDPPFAELRDAARSPAGEGSPKDFESKEVLDSSWPATSRRKAMGKPLFVRLGGKVSIGESSCMLRRFVSPKWAMAS